MPEGLTKRQQISWNRYDQKLKEDEEKIKEKEKYLIDLINNMNEEQSNNFLAKLRENPENLKKVMEIYLRHGSPQI